MSIFKNHKTSADRSATDRSRHRKKIKEAIKEGVHHIVSEESIIGKCIELGFPDEAIVDFTLENVIWRKD